jgi:hypothetical protein
MPLALGLLPFGFQQPRFVDFDQNMASKSRTSRAGAENLATRLVAQKDYR